MASKNHECLCRGPYALGFVLQCSIDREAVIPEARFQLFHEERKKGALSGIANCRVREDPGSRPG